MTAELVQALQRRWGARLIETHISWVLLDGVHAWKIKKPVKLPFLDASELTSRQCLCEAELRLNQRLAPSLYLDVVAIGGTPEAPSLPAQGPPIEYALRMRQFDAGALLLERLQAGTLLPAHMDKLAHTLAAFHMAAPVAPAGSSFGSPAAIEAATKHVLDGLSPQGDEAVVEPLRSWLNAQAVWLRPIWSQRQAQGHVVEGHGDLHLANALVLGDEVTAFDCIEFDASLRWIDAFNDIAFVVMDLQAHRRADLACRFLNAYLDETGDHAGLPTLRYALVYRALVRALVARLRGAAADGVSQPDYLAVAGQLSEPVGARLLITHGLSGSGKSHVTQGLLAHSQAIRLRSDVERKRLYGRELLDHSAQRAMDPLYGPEAAQRTYACLRDKAAIALAAGYPVIVDAACLRLAEREGFRALAASMGVPFTILHCQASEATLRERVGARTLRADDASDADLAVLAAQHAQVESLREHELPDTIVFDAAAPLMLADLAARWAAVKVIAGGAESD